MPKTKTHPQFLKELILKNKYYKEGNFNVIGKYKKALEKILISNKYGKCLIRPNDLLKGVEPTIESSINKDKYFTNKAKEIHENKYSYNSIEYKQSKTKVKILCNTHNEYFYQTPNTHLSGRGCPKCKSDKMIKNPVSWSYSNWKKASQKSNNFDSYKIYIIKCWNDEEEFYKIGKTFRTIENRFRSDYRLPYNYKVIEIIESDNARYICDLEKKLQKTNKHLKYIPKISFGGMYECFSKII